MLDTFTNDNSTVVTSGLAERAAKRLAPGIDWSDMGRNDHFVQFYDADDHLANSVAEYFVHGLRAGEACLMVATRAHRDTITEKIRSFEPDFQQYVNEGNFVVLDAVETLSKFIVRSRPDREAFDTIVGQLVRDLGRRAPRVRIFGEMVAVLVDEDNSRGAVELENLWNELGRRADFLLFCAYASAAFRKAGAAVSAAAICSSHSHVIPSEAYTSLSSAPDRLQYIARLQQRTLQLEADLREMEAKIAGVERPLI